MHASLPTLIQRSAFPLGIDNLSRSGNQSGFPETDCSQPSYHKDKGPDKPADWTLRQPAPGKATCVWKGAGEMRRAVSTFSEMPSLHGASIRDPLADTLRSHVVPAT